MSDKVYPVPVPSSHANEDSAHRNLTIEKATIKRHPLFPLLALAFEKCELATCTPRHSGIHADICSSQSFSEDIHVFANQVKSKSSVFTSDHHADTLMVQAVQVLRIHLLEIEKVHHLCDNFCKRYISSLEGKMPLDLVLQEGCGEIKHFSTERNSPNTLELFPNDAENPLPSLYSSPSDIYQTASYERGENFSKTLPSCALSRRTDTEGSSPASSEATADSIESFVGQEEDENDRPKQKKRGIFPKMATNIMKAWLFQHLAHPYPSEDQKRILANDTGLTILQVNNWFINARRRIVQPMIDASSRAGKTPVITVFKSRKRKMTSPDVVQNDPCYSSSPSHFQQPSAYHQNYHYPPNHSAYYADTSLHSSQFVSPSHPSCQYLSGPPVDSSQGVPSLPSCMETKSQGLQTPYGHWVSNSNPQICPTYASETQLQSGQFYVKAS